MAKKFSDLRRSLEQRLDERPDGERIRQEVADELRAELDAHAQSLAKVRKARGLTQVQLAELLDVSQAQVSRIESQTDLYLSTLSRYLEAAGGRLFVGATFDTDGDEIVVLDISEVARPDAESSGRNLRAVGPAVAGIEPV